MAGTDMDWVMRFLTKGKPYKNAKMLEEAATVLMRDLPPPQPFEACCGCCRQNTEVWCARLYRQDEDGNPVQMPELLCMQCYQGKWEGGPTTSPAYVRFHHDVSAEFLALPTGVVQIECASSYVSVPKQWVYVYLDAKGCRAAIRFKKYVDMRNHFKIPQHLTKAALTAMRYTPPRRPLSGGSPTRTSETWYSIRLRRSPGSRVRRSLRRSLREESLRRSLRRSLREMRPPRRPSSGR
jgi:hypothetical protein